MAHSPKLRVRILHLLPSINKANISTLARGCRLIARAISLSLSLPSIRYEAYKERDRVANAACSLEICGSVPRKFVRSFVRLDSQIKHALPHLINGE